MQLVIPSIEIKEGKCVRAIRSIEGYAYSRDPVEMAKLWRKENAKSLHVTDIDGARQGRPVNFGIIRAMVETVDIPVELGGGIRSFEDIELAITNGIYRVVLGTLLVESPDVVRRAIEKFGPSKIVLGLDRHHHPAAFIDTKGDPQASIIDFTLSAKSLGVRRIVYTDVITDGLGRRPNFEGIRLLAENTQMRITTSGGISSLDDLLNLQRLENLGVDSVIIGRALYENKFSCQSLWRLCEAGNYPYTAKI